MYPWMSDCCGTDYQFYRTNTFQEIWDSADKFVAEYKANGIKTTISDDSCTTLYYLLYAKYGNNPIASSDQNRFKYAVWATIFKYGPTWEKRLEIQDKLRTLSEYDLTRSGKSIFNHAYNPSTEPSTGSLEELPGINEQNTNQYVKSKIDAYASLMDLLMTDVTEAFLGKFRKLFKICLVENPLFYVTDLKEGEIQ